MDNDDENMMEEEEGSAFEEGKEVKVFGQIRSFQVSFVMCILFVYMNKLSVINSETRPTLHFELSFVLIPHRSST